MGAWGIKNTKNCTFCNGPKETVKHLFVECSLVKDAWQEVRLFFQIPEAKPVEILLCRLNNSKRHVHNLVGLVFMQYVYSMKCLEKGVSGSQIINKVLYIKNIEKYIAISNNLLQKHEKKWCEIDKVFSN